MTLIGEIEKLYSENERLASENDTSAKKTTELQLKVNELLEKSSSYMSECLSLREKEREREKETDRKRDAQNEKEMEKEREREKERQLAISDLKNKCSLAENDKNEALTKLASMEQEIKELRGASQDHSREQEEERQKHLSETAKLKSQVASLQEQLENEKEEKSARPSDQTEADSTSSRKVDELKAALKACEEEKGEVERQAREYVTKVLFIITNFFDSTRFSDFQLLLQK